MSNPEFQPSEAHHLDLAIIDDNPADTRLLCRLLDRLPGWEFDYKTYISAADAEAGFADDMPDIVIVDYLLGDETGIDIIKRFTEREISADLILLTGQGDETVAVESMRAGAADYLRKDELSARTIEHSLRYIYEKRQSAEELRLAYADLENRVEERTKELSEALRQTELANRAKTEFLANISHELRTPLNAIIGFSHMLQATTLEFVDENKRIEYLGFIQESGEHLLKLINDILDVSKIEERKLILHDEEIVIEDLFDSCIGLVSARVEEKSLVIKSSVSPTLPKLLVDERALKQVLLNLLSNAVKFTPEGGSIDLSAAVAIDGRFEIKIRDTGIGMDDAGITIALAKFGQVDSDLAREYEGTGLGLPLSQGLVEAHGGVLEVTSEPGQGTVVTIILPKERVVLEPLHSVAL